MSRLNAQLSALCLHGSSRSVTIASSTLQTLAARPFSVTPISNRRHAKKQLYLEHKDVPEYPHGPARLYKKSNFGLYAGARVRFGNIVSKGKWVKKTRRKWWPNVQRTQLYSEGMGTNVDLKVTTSVLRTIDKVGGLDNYLLGSTSQRIKDLGMAGWKLRWELMQRPEMKAKFAKQREAMGLAAKEITEELESLESAQAEFKQEYALKPVEERSAGFFNKRKRKDIWRGQLLPVYLAAVQRVWKDMPERTPGAEHWIDAKADITEALLSSKA